MYGNLELFIDGKWLGGDGRKGEDVTQSGDRKAARPSAACEQSRSRPGAGSGQERLRGVARHLGL